MADIKVLKINSDQEYEQHSPTADSIQLVSFKTASKELTDSKLGNLIDGATNSTEHDHDTYYFRESEHVTTSAGAGDSGKPIVLDSNGQVDATMINDGDIAHDSTSGAAASTIHTSFPLLDGTRPYTGDQDMGGNLITGLGEPTNANDAVRKSYADAVAAGFGPKRSVVVATTAALTATYDNGTSGVGATLTNSGTQAAISIDGVALSLNDRVLVKDQAAALQNGIYTVTTVGDGSTNWVLTRATDFDNNPDGEIRIGDYTFVEDGTANAGYGYTQVDFTTGDAVGTDAINFTLFSSPTELTAGDGIDISANVVSTDLLASGGLKIVSTELAVEPDDFAGEGLIDDGSDNLAIDWSTTFTDAKAIKAEDLASTANGEGASIIGSEDTGGYYSGTDVEAILQEIGADLANISIISLTAGTGGISKGDLVYISANDTCLPLDITTNEYAVGIALENASAGNPVNVVQANQVLTSVLTSATAGTKYFWSGTGWQTTAPSTTGTRVWLGFIAKNTTDAITAIEFLYRNS